jgi:hypothetical protein
MLRRAIVGASHDGDKECRLVSFMQHSLCATNRNWSRIILFRPYVSHAYLLQQSAAHQAHEANPDAVRKSQDEAMSLDLSMDGLVKAIACDRRFKKIANA